MNNQETDKIKKPDELVIANEELALKNDEKEKRAAELVIANEELFIQNKEKDKRITELLIANQELESKVEIPAMELVNKDLMYKQILNNLLEGCMMISFDWTYIYLNEVAAQHGQKNREDLIGRTMLEMYPGVEKSRIFNYYQLCMKDRTVQQFEELFTFTNGITAWYKISVEPIPEGIFVLSIDITEHKTAEEKINKANRLYNVISQINQLIVRTTDEQTLFEEICNNAIDPGKFRMAWIGMVDKKTKKLIPVAHAGEEHGYLSEIETISVDDVVEGRGPAGTAIREGKYTVCNDIENNPNMTPWKKEALNHGYYSSIGLPIKKSGKVIGVFNLYAAEPNFFNDREITLLGEITGDISFALENFEKEEQRKNAEAALTEKEFFLRESQKAGLIGSYKTNFITGYWQSSGTLDDIFGIDKSYIRSIEGWKEIVHPDDQNTMDEYLRLEVIGKQKSFNKEYKIKRINDKQTRWVCGLGNVKFDDTGNITELIGTIQDITERKNAEESLLQSETNLRTIFENTDTGFYLLDNEANIIAFNKKVNQFAILSFGFELQEKKNLIKLFVPERQQQFADMLSEIIKGSNFDYEINYPQKDGAIIWYNVHANQVCDSTGKVIGICVSVNDITERKKAEDKISESEEIFRRLFNESADSTLLLDDIGFTDCNQSAISILGYSSRQEVLNKKPCDISPEKQPDGRLSSEKAKEMIAKAAQQGYNRFEWVHTKADGRTEFSVEVMLTPITLKGRQSFYTVWRDIAERKEAEEKLKETTTQLSIAAEIAKLGYWELDLTKGLFTFTDQLYAIFRTTAEKMGGYTMMPDRYNELFVHPDDRVVVGEEVVRAIQSDDPYFDRKIEHRIIYSTGEVGYISVRLFLVKDDKGRTIKTFGVNQDITERKKAEEAIVKERDLSNSIINSLPGIFYLFDETGKFLRWNKNFETVSGYSAAEISQLHPLDLFDTDEKQLLREKIEEVFTIGRADIEASFFTKTKEEIPYYFNGWQIIFEGKPCLIGVGIDITERKKAEVQLSKSESKFRHLMDAIPDALLGTNKEGEIVYTNLQASILFGYSTNELLNNKVEMLLPEQFHSRHESNREDYQANPVSREMGKVGMPLYGRRKDGSEFATEISLSSIETEEGLVVLSAIRDITEKKKAEQAIIHSEARYKKAQEVAHLGNWELDFANGNTFMSDEACRIHGIPLLQNEQSPEAWLSFIHPEDLDFVSKNMKEAQDHLSDFVLNYRIKRKDGTIRHIYSETKIQFDSTGKPTGMYGIAHDITETIKAEEELKKYAEDLKNSNTELEQFAYVASHDLQEPLRMVTSFLNLLEKRMGGQLDDTNKQYIHFAVDGAMRMKTLIQDLLQYSRVGTNKESFTATNLNEVMLYVTQLLEDDIKKKQALITVKPMPVVKANKMLISQLFVNLVSNALKYHEDKEPEIEVGCTEEPGNYIFYVKDNGIGIDPQFFNKIFNIFQRLHNKSEYSGSGIGLAICKKIVEIHNGKIWVESEPGKGSIFYFSIPKHTTSR